MDAASPNKLSFWRQRCAIVLLLGCTLTASGCRAIEHRIVFNPYVYPESWCEPTPEELCGLDFEDVHFESLDGTQLHGWLIWPKGQFSRNPIMFAHGRTGHVSSHKQRLIEFVHTTQSTVFLFDYRGFGKSEGCPTECGLYQDVAAARNWLAHRAGIERSEVVLMGRSLGAAAVIDLASREGAKALIVQSSFTSSPDVLKHHTFGILHGSRLETCFDSVGKIGNYQGPILISHSCQDKALPYSHGVRLADAAINASRVLFMKLQGGHCDPPSEDYYVVLAEFLDSLQQAHRPGNEQELALRTPARSRHLALATSAEIAR